MLIHRFCKFLTIFLCTVIVLDILLFYFAHSLPWRTNGRASKETPYHFVNSKTYFSSITDVKACGHYVYILYGDKCTLACYDTEGNYLHSYVFKMIKNGKAKLFVVDDILYLEAKGHDYYLLKDGKFIQHIAHNTPKAQSIEDMLNNSPKNDGISFTIRGASVWKKTQDSTQEFIHRPEWFVLANEKVQLSLYLFSLVSLAFVYVFYWKRT